MLKLLKSLYENYINKEVDKDPNNLTSLSNLTSLTNDYINSSATYNEHLDAAKQAITTFKVSPKFSQDLKNLYSSLHTSVEHCSETFCHNNFFTQTLGRDIIEFKIYQTISSLL